MNSKSNTIVNNFHFKVVHKIEELNVVCIPLNNVPSVAWILLREFISSKRTKTTFNSLLLDDDGLSVVCSPISMNALQNLCPIITDDDHIFIIWNYFIINVISSDFPGAVNYLSDSLSKQGISILHISTFEAEVFLVQENDIERACEVFKKVTNINAFSEIKKQEQQKQNSYLNSKVADLNITETLPPVPPKFVSGFELKVIPNPLMLARFTSEESLSECSDILTNLLLFDERYSVLERKLSNLHTNPSVSSTVLKSLDSSSNGSSNKDRTATFMWGLWRCEDELTLLVEELDIMRFPEDCLIISPQQWRVIKLCGRQINFDEYGIISAMSKIEHDIPSLCISSATTCCTLVPEELLEETLKSLSESLCIPFTNIN